jgi:ankyrin repeat protein
MEAARAGCSQTVELLLARRAVVDAKNTANDTALTYAASQGHLPVVNILLAAKADHSNKSNFKPYWTPLITATQGNHIGVMVVLLAAKADPNETPMYPSQRLLNPFWTAARNNNTAALRLLIDAKADVNKGALQAAVFEGANDTVKLLLDAKADVGIENALETAKSQQKKLKLLIGAKAGEDATEFNEEDLQEAVASYAKDTWKVLRDAKADANTKEAFSKVVFGESASDAAKLLRDAKPNDHIKCVKAFYTTRSQQVAGIITMLETAKSEG